MIINIMFLPLFARISKHEQICQLVASICFHKCIFVWYGTDLFMWSDFYNTVCDFNLRTDYFWEKENECTQLYPLWKQREQCCWVLLLLLWRLLANSFSSTPFLCHPLELSWSLLILLNGGNGLLADMKACSM